MKLSSALIGALLGCAAITTIAGTPSFAPVHNLPTANLSGSIVVGDFNGDGKPDLFAINFASTTMYLGDGEGNFTLKPGAPVITTSASLGVAADFNDDGKLDIAITNFAGSNVFILLGNGDGTFAAPASVASGLHPLGIVALDLNDDGNLDLVIANNGANNVQVLFGNGSGGFTPGPTYAVGREPRGLVVGDFNGDRMPDIAVVNFRDNNVSLLAGAGDGTFAAAVNLAVGNGPHGIAAADLDGNGALDLIVTNNSGDTISVLLADGDGGFAPAVSYGTGALPRFVAIADFDGDDKLDLAVTNNGSSTVSLFAGNGNGTFAAAVSFGTGQTPNDIKGIDFNGDDRIDLAVANFGGASSGVLLNATAPCVIPGCAGYVTGSVVEFYNTTLDNFFITADPNEQTAVASGAAGPGWTITGNVFRAGGPSLVCRFYGSITPGPNSHFYTIDPAECQQLKDLQASTPATQKRWNFESNDFASTKPEDGICPAGTVPVYRAYNNGFTRSIDSNHRITSNLAAYLAQVSKGWSGEGVVMCAASASGAPQ